MAPRQELKGCPRYRIPCGIPRGKISRNGEHTFLSLGNFPKGFTSFSQTIVDFPILLNDCETSCSPKIFLPGQNLHAFGKRCVPNCVSCREIFHSSFRHIFPTFAKNNFQRCFSQVIIKCFPKILHRFSPKMTKY